MQHDATTKWVEVETKKGMTEWYHGRFQVWELIFDDIWGKDWPAREVEHYCLSSFFMVFQEGNVCIVYPKCHSASALLYVVLFCTVSNSIQLSVSCWYFVVCGCQHVYFGAFNICFEHY